MIKKILIVFSIFLMVGCTSVNINTQTLSEIIDSEIKEQSKSATINNKGYKYYLPSGFSVSKDNTYIQELLSNGTTYYLNIDIISYYYKNKMSSNHELDDYEYYEFENKGTNGYLRIRKNNDNYFVELCYNYAIIEVEVKESELRYAVSRGIMILNSIKYNNSVIEKHINDNDLETSETVYKIPEPENNEAKNVLEFIEEYNEE